MVLVRDVPMLAPMINGIAIGMGSPPATIPTMMDVTVLELWISAVAATPIIRPTGVGGEREQFLGVVADRRFEAISDSTDGRQQQIDQCDDQQPRQPLARSGCGVVG